MSNINQIEINAMSTGYIKNQLKRLKNDNNYNVYKSKLEKELTKRRGIVFKSIK